MSITKRFNAYKFLLTHLDKHEVQLPEYDHFALPGHPDLGLALWKGDNKDSIVCDLTVHEAERDLWWCAGDQADMTPEHLRKHYGFRNDYKSNKEGFNEYIAMLLTAMMEAA